MKSDGHERDRCQYLDLGFPGDGRAIGGAGADVVNTAEQALEIVERLDSPACEVLLDTFHMNIEEKLPAAAIRAVGSRLVNFHACGTDRGAPGSDHTNWEEIFAALIEIDYRDALVIESFTAENTTIATAASIWRRLAPTQDELATDGLAFLREMLAG